MLKKVIIPSRKSARMCSGGSRATHAGSGSKQCSRCLAVTTEPGKAHRKSLGRAGKARRRQRNSSQHSVRERLNLSGTWGVVPAVIRPPRAERGCAERGIRPAIRGAERPAADVYSAKRGIAKRRTPDWARSKRARKNPLSNQKGRMSSFVLARLESDQVSAQCRMNTNEQSKRSFPSN